ncbi:hypothetical protein IWW47_000149 [Coemansia sp. RSA 2052]|nr:hypothetical protein IWW47_000149 [Coemansia sp. RSA 2052]
MEPNSPEDIAKKRLASSNNTGSSINLSFDHSFSPEDLKLLSLSTVRLGTFVPDVSMGKHATVRHQIQDFSSNSQLLPKVQEIHGSSDSTSQHAPLLAPAAEAADVHEATTNTSFTDSYTSNNDSMTTADMIFSDGNKSTRSLVQNSTASMRAAAMAFAGSNKSTRGFAHSSSASMRAAVMDEELQAAVDVMLQGSVPLAAPDCAYYNEDKMLSHTVTPPPRAAGASMPPLASSIYSSSGSQRTSTSASYRRGPYYNAIQSTRQLRQKLSARFVRRRRYASTATTTDDDAGDNSLHFSSTDMLLLDKDAAAKRKLGSSVEDTREKRAKTSGDAADPHMRSLEPAAPPSPWIPKFLYSVMYYVQLRPLRALGIVLTVLIVLLVLLIVVLIVGVFPFLMRSTLHDFSLVVTSLHAIPPPEIAQTLPIGDRSLSRTRLMAMHDGRVGKEFVARPDLVSHVPVDEIISGLPASVQHVQSLMRVLQQPQHPLLSTPLSQTPAVAMTPRSSAIQAAPPVSRALVLSSDAPNLARVAMSPTSIHKLWPSIGSMPIIDDEDAQVTITSTSVSTVHIQRKLDPAATIAAAPIATMAPALVPSGDIKALDTGSPLASSTYMMQLAGNLTSGGPIGVHIEFTEPVRLLWHDTVVGIIRYPESINVPGRGTTQWKWPPFEVSIPVNGTSLASDDRRLVRKQGSHLGEQPAPPQSLIQLGADRIIDSSIGGIAQRRVMGSGNSATLGRNGVSSDPSAASASDLAGWFAAIQTHRSFTMHWKSTVKVSAMGMHTSNIKFEKSVRVVCGEGEGKSCSITDRPFTF